MIGPATAAPRAATMIWSEKGVSLKDAFNVIALCLHRAVMHETAILLPHCPTRATRQWQLRLPPLDRRIALLRKVFSVPHHLHDIDGGRGTHNRTSSRRSGTDRHHAGHGDCSRNNSRREDDGDLAHLALLSKTLSINPVQPGSRSRRRKLFWGNHALLTENLLCFAAHLIQCSCVKILRPSTAV